MKVLKGDLFDYAEQGYIVHQVNCQNSMRSGFAGEFIKRYPKIKEAYHQEVEKFDRTEKSLLNHLQYVQLNEKLIGVNSFTQEYFGNAYKNKVKYTDENGLLHNIETVLLKASETDSFVYMPEFIGCGLGGGNWDNILQGLSAMDTSSLVVVGRHL